MNTKHLNFTLAVLKPHVVKHPFAVNEIKNRIVNSGLSIIKCKQIMFTNELSDQFYKEHKGRFFYNRLVTFMESGLSEACIISGANAISKWRELMGPTKIYKAIYSHPESIRSLYGLSDTRNATHGSDSLESAIREISIIFPEFEQTELVKLLNSEINLINK